MIRAAVPSDLSAVAEIYRKIHDREEAGLVTIGWQRAIYPTASTAQAALAAGDLFVLEQGGRILAAGRINQEQLDAYFQCPWAYRAPPEQVLVLHTLVVDPEAAGQGLGTQFVSFYESHARQLGCTVLRLDTNAINTAARRLYHHLGFREAAILPVTFNGIPGVQLVCLEKQLVS